MAEATAAVAQARLDLDRTVIRSPIDGIVIARNVDVGQTVAATVQAPVLFTIAANLEKLQLNVEIDESDVGGIESGESSTFTVESYPGEIFSGRVSQVRLQPVAETGAAVSYATIIDVANADERLRPGMTATVSLPGARRANVLRIPNNALLFRPSLDVLSAVKQTGAVPPPDSFTDPTRRRVWRFDGRVFIPIDVRVGLADGQWTELASGPLGAGDALVTSARDPAARE